MKNVRVKVEQTYRYISDYRIGIYEGKKLLMAHIDRTWITEEAAIRNAKAMAKRIGIPYSDEIIKPHGC